MVFFQRLQKFQPGFDLVCRILQLAIHHPRFASGRFQITDHQVHAGGCIHGQGVIFLPQHLAEGVACGQQLLIGFGRIDPCLFKSAGVPIKNAACHRHWHSQQSALHCAGIQRTLAELLQIDHIAIFVQVNKLVSILARPGPVHLHHIGGLILVSGGAVDGFYSNILQFCLKCLDGLLVGFGAGIVPPPAHGQGNGFRLSGCLSGGRLLRRAAGGQLQCQCANQRKGCGVCCCLVHRVPFLAVACNVDLRLPLL